MAELFEQEALSAFLAQSFHRTLQIRFDNMSDVPDLPKWHSVGSLKKQCHEAFAVLGQFCAKIITLRL